MPRRPVNSNVKVRFSPGATAALGRQQSVSLPEPADGFGREVVKFEGHCCNDHLIMNEYRSKHSVMLLLALLSRGTDCVLPLQKRYV